MGKRRKGIARRLTLESHRLHGWSRPGNRNNWSTGRPRCQCWRHRARRPMFPSAKHPRAVTNRVCLPSLLLHSLRSRIQGPHISSRSHRITAIVRGTGRMCLGWLRSLAGWSCDSGRLLALPPLVQASPSDQIPLARRSVMHVLVSAVDERMRFMCVCARLQTDDACS
jgi:hypothetical protein